MEDGAGAELKSHGGLVMEAGGNIMLKAAELKCSSPVGSYSVRQVPIWKSTRISIFTVRRNYAVYISKRMGKRRNVKKGEEQGLIPPCWEGAYAAVGFHWRFFGKEVGETTSLEMTSAAGIPSIGSGKR